MVTFGEDSLNEHTEDKDATQESNSAGSLDLLRMKLRKSTVKLPPTGSAEAAQKAPVDDEPTTEQLIATGELDPDDLAEVPGVEPPLTEPGSQEASPSGLGASTSLTVPDTHLSVRKQVEQLALAGVTQDEVIRKGFHKRSVQTIFSELKSRGKIPGGQQSSRASEVTSDGLHIFAKGAPPESIIGALRVPDVADGQGYPFEQGIKFGMSLIILGVRVAQELSGIGITQAKPILDMAKSMREGEAVAAKNAAGEAAMEAAGMVRQDLMPMLVNLQNSSGGGGGANPMQTMMAKTMEPIMQKLIGGVMGKLLPGTNTPLITDGKGAIEGWTRKSE